ncbi:MAG: hypothetical protein JSU65_00480 [Candidatus Zixiibacteriota bacterium]|nr:MAG: hypothetical protein JSU65_00480 [candidate division Zixibacteria bacterium]
MEIGLIYSRKDPLQTKARDFIRRYVRERGVLARIHESEQPVKSPTVIIDGHTLKDKRSKPRGKKPRMYPSLEDIHSVLEEHIWCL